MTVPLYSSGPQWEKKKEYHSLLLTLELNYSLGQFLGTLQKKKISYNIVWLKFIQILPIQFLFKGKTGNKAETQGYA